jgi:hypothetical protein
MRKGRKVSRKLNSTGPRRVIDISVAAAFTTVTLMIAGCSRAPSFNLLGSFFPAWILCGVLGILLTVAARLFFVRIKLEQQLKPLILVYPCLAAFFTFTLWLLFFS